MRSDEMFMTLFSVWLEIGVVARFLNQWKRKPANEKGRAVDGAPRFAKRIPDQAFACDLEPIFLGLSVPLLAISILRGLSASGISRTRST